MIDPANFVLLALPDLVVYPAAVFFVLGVLVFVHELGHYLVAKFFRVRVETFSLGFGKRLWGFRRGDTDYRISLLPLGGYVKMAGENPMEERTGDPGEFMSHPRWQRFLIAIAGPAMNVILALVVLTGLYMFHHGYSAVMHSPVDVVWITSNSPAAKAGIQQGDRIVKVQDIENPDWQQFLTTEMISPNRPISLTVRRNGQLLPMTVTTLERGPDRIGDIGVEPPEVVGELTPGGPADQAGVRVGDVMISVGGTQIKSVDGMLNALQLTKDKTVDLTVLRNSQELKIPVTPRLLPDKYRIGLRAGKIEKLPFAAAASTAYVDCRDNSLLIFKLVGGMLQRKVPIQQMSGPIGIMRISGEAARSGWPDLLYIMSLISINLAVFNLFPIPILDGGLMLMLLIESTLRRDIKQEIKERVYQAAFVFLVLFAAVVIFNDIAKSFHG